MQATIKIGVMVFQPANFGRGVARQDSVADFIDAALDATEIRVYLFALGNSGRITPQFNRCQYIAI